METIVNVKFDKVYQQKILFRRKGKAILVTGHGDL
jgi:hypothetical protein